MQIRRRSFGRRFKLKAIHLVEERCVSVVQASRDLDVGENLLRAGSRSPRLILDGVSGSVLCVSTDDHGIGLDEVVPSDAHQPSDAGR